MCEQMKKSIFPKYLSIQTTSLCNASCIFCPYDEIKDMFPRKIMDMELFRKIIDETSGYKNTERIILYMNNEPLTDPFLVERINYAKEKVPWAAVHILTNGALLTEEISEKLIDSKLDWVGISFHGIKRKTIEKSMKIPYALALERINRFIDKAKQKKDIRNYLMITFLRHQYLTLEEKEEAISYWKAKGIERISYFNGPVSRGGNASNLPKTYHKGKIIGCNSIWADEMVHIVEDGRVVLCCMDWKREVALGDLNNKTIYDIWHGSRRHIWSIISGEQNMPEKFLCRNCEEAVTLTKGRCCSDFILVNLPPWAQENPHIGIGYLNAYLRNNGVIADVLDLNKSFFLNYPDFRMLWHVENKSFWSNEDTFLLILEIFKKDIEGAIDKILSYDCDILGFSVIDPKERLTIEFIKRIKRKAPDKRIVLGGPATSTPEQRKIFLDNIDNHIDAFVVGEGEETLQDLISKFKGEKDIKDIAGCFVKDSGKWVCKKRAAISPLDKASFPTYEEFDMSLYGKSLLVEWSRGCLGKCAFCKNWRLSSFYRSRNADNVLNELLYHKQSNGISDFTVTDNILNGDLVNLDKICDKIIENNLEVRWTGQIAPRKDMNHKLFRKMRQAGCYKLQIGLESASNKVLKLMRKTFTAEVSEKNIRSAKKAEIEVEVFVMIGFPGETDYDFKKTCAFIKRNRAHIDTIKSINTLHLVAGTEVFEKGKEIFGMKPLPKENWHYLWETYDGNTYEIRKKRAKKLLNLATILKIKVMETNIGEGKEKTFEIGKEKDSLGRKILLLKESINSLQELPREKTRIRKKRRNIFKWIGLIFIFIYILFYIFYFWIYMFLCNKILLGGKKR